MRFVPTVSFAAAALILGTGAGAQEPAQTTAQAPAAATAAPAVERDPEAIAALERMGAYLRTLTTFGVSGDVTTEDVLETGQSLQYTGAVDMVVRRPTHLRANVDSARKRRQYFYDGRNLTIWAPRQGFYATVEAPPTIGGMIEMASERFDVVVPFADLFELGVNPELTSRITSAFLVGTEAVDDQVCTHYAFRQPNVDWEMWIREGDQPLPCRYRITALDDEARPDYEVRIVWDLERVVTDEAFIFVPPEGADRISIAPVVASRQ